MKAPIVLPAVHLILRAHPPAPARVSLVRRPLAGRLARTLVTLVVLWGAIPWSVWVPPHYPWPVALFFGGAFLAHRFWTGRYRVRWFHGECPRCARPLRLRAGASIDLPHTLTCFHCHFEPTLETYTEAGEERIAAEDARHVRHLLGDCAGTWRERTRDGQPFLDCDGCGARHHATPALRAAAAAENDRGDLLRQLADEGRFLAD